MSGRSGGEWATSTERYGANDWWGISRMNVSVRNSEAQTPNVEPRSSSGQCGAQSEESNLAVRIEGPQTDQFERAKPKSAPFKAPPKNLLR